MPTSVPSKALAINCVPIAMDPSAATALADTRKTASDVTPSMVGDVFLFNNLPN